MSLSPFLRWLIFASVLIVWTIGLLLPDPGSSAVEEVGGAKVKFLLAKTLHVCAYAFVTFLAGLVVRSRSGAWMILSLLVTHAAGTELLQPFFQRGGSVRDVCLDVLGIGLGVGVNWRCWKILFGRARPQTDATL